MHRHSAHICNTYNIGNNFHKAYLPKYKSSIHSMYNLYKLTVTYKYTNYTLNTVFWTEHIRADAIFEQVPFID